MKKINKNIELLTNNSIVPINTKLKLKLQQNKKPKLVIASIYLLVFGITTLTTSLLLFNCNPTFNNTIFNPNANNNIWNNYYEQHEKNHQLVNLNGTVDYFSKNNISFSVTNQAEINYYDILNAIDSNLQNNKIEVKNNNINNNLLPTAFFSNIIYNPAISFTINDTPLVNFPFKIPEIYDHRKDYQLHFTTNNDSEAFGIAKGNNTMDINVIVKNEVAINLNDIKLGNLNGTISVPNPKKTAVKDIVNSLTPTIKTAFTTVLAAKLGMDPKKIIDDYYQIDFLEKDQIFNFTNLKTLNFIISTNSKIPNKWNFYGSCKGTISVINTTVDLSKETTLSTNISSCFDESKKGKGIRVDIDNSKDKTNIDTNLTADGLNSVNESVFAAIEPTITNYFNQKFPTLAISNKDYNITVNNIEKGANIFALTKGKVLNISIKATNNTYKLKGILNTTVTIHGHNQNAVNALEYKQPDDFKIIGVDYPGNKDKDILQAKTHYYEQHNLFNNWIGNKDSLLNTIKNNTYGIEENSFKGNININAKLDNVQIISQNIKIEDIKSDKVTNFYQLLKNTKFIYLKTRVNPATATHNTDTLEEIKFIFTSEVVVNVDSDISNITLYTIDLWVKPDCAIMKNAPLVFNNFDFNINYEQFN